jgi:hypothetical protein
MRCHEPRGPGVGGRSSIYDNPLVCPMLLGLRLQNLHPPAACFCSCNCSTAQSPVTVIITKNLASAVLVPTAECRMPVLYHIILIPYYGEVHPNPPKSPRALAVGKHIYILYTYIYIYIYWILYIYIYIYMYIYIYIYGIHTHTHTYIYICVCVCVYVPVTSIRDVPTGHAGSEEANWDNTS